MFTEYEVETILEHHEILDAVIELKKDFIRNEAPYLEISDHDFCSLVLMSPIVGIALANDSVSLFEELALNKKARKLSKGGYFMKKDPVVYAMKFLISKYHDWEEKFFTVLKLAMSKTFDKSALLHKFDPNMQVSSSAYKKEVLATPYILIRFISSFFLDQDEDIINSRSIAKVEHECLVQIGKKLELDQVPVFHMFCNTFNVK
jgi:hypothetical protein